MSRTVVLLLVFALAFAVFFMGPAFMGSPFGPYPLMKWGDVFDLLTPLVLIPLYWFILSPQDGRSPRLAVTLGFMVVAALWAEGQGMHLAGNSIGHQLEDLAGTAAFRLTGFYDEVLSHYLWHAGVIGMVVLWLAGHWENRVNVHAGEWATIAVAGLIHGFLLFTILVEGQTWPMLVPFAVLVSAFLLIWGRARLGHQPVMSFVLISHLVALAFTVGWAVYWGGLPEFSEVGII